jgi:hypothetical protein
MDIASDVMHGREGQDRTRQDRAEQGESGGNGRGR